VTFASGIDRLNEADPQPGLNFALSPSQREFSQQLHDWVDRECPPAYARCLEARDEYPFELHRKLAEAGYHGLSIPQEYGGMGGDNLMQMLLARGLGRSLAGLTWVWGSTSFAGANSIGLYGSDTQKQQFLPAIASGDMRVTIAFTEPDGGTDLLGGLKTSAAQVDGGWIINGTKRWCTSAHVSDYILLLARTDHQVTRHQDGVTLFLVPCGSVGLSMVPMPTLGMRALSAFELNLQDVFVSDSMVLGEPGQAWYMLLPTLNNERLVLLGLCCGMLDGILDGVLAYAKDRQAFGRTIGEFQAIQHYIADIAIARRQTELVAHHAAWLDVTGQPGFLELTMGKVIATEHVVRAADLGIQILGGMGYSAETDMQRYWRDSRLYRMSPVTNEMARNLVAEQLGLPRCF
jgi:alkylation response protein AidB-like acyl-CoA dehydrogenase